jgi:mono/diheme cytochrome c family protein
MDRSLSAITFAAVAAGVTVLVIGPLVGGAASPVSPASQPEPGPSSVSVGGVTLRSVNVDIPNGDRQFEGSGAEVVNNNCLACHSAGMVLTQPRLPRAVWQAEVDKMRKTYKAPVDAKDVPAIVDYLATLPR